MKGPMMAIDKAIEGRDWEGFKLAYEIGITTANSYHRVWEHDEIVWQLPGEPPRHLKLTATEESST